MVAALASPPPKRGKPVERGQAEIENNRIVRLGIAEKPGFLAVRCLVHRIARTFKRRRNLSRQPGVVLGEKNSHLLVPLGFCRCTWSVADQVPR